MCIRDSHRNLSARFPKQVTAIRLAQLQRGKGVVREQLFRERHALRAAVALDLAVVSREGMAVDRASTRERIEAIRNACANRPLDPLALAENAESQLPT